MTVVYVDSVFLLNGAMDYLLCLVTARLAGVPLRRRRYALAAMLGGSYAAAVFLPGCGFLASWPVKLAAGVLMAKLMNVFSKTKVNPLIGSAGVSAVPMAARVSNKVSLQNDPTNFVLMQAMGPNVSGVIGSAVVAGVLYTLCK